MPRATTAKKPIVRRAWCPECEDFFVAPGAKACLKCGKPKDDRYDYIEAYDGE